jgi:two-component system cell cycle response regulator
MARILVIDDNLDNLELMTYLLKAFGHQTTRETDGESGVAAVRREQPELVVCDVHLPKLDGYGVARHLKGDAATRQIPLIAVTALAMVGDRDKVLAAGFDCYIAKPIDPKRFVEQVEAFLPEDRRGVSPFPQSGSASTLADPSRPILATLLVVDDSPVNRELIRQTLEPSGYRIWSAESVAGGLTRLRSGVPDLILSDLHMSGEDGFHFIRAVKADPRLAAVPFVLITSSVWGEKDRAKALALGVARFLLRPIEPQALIDEIAACVPRRDP